jgi:exonuclease III
VYTESSSVGAFYAVSMGQFLELLCWNVRGLNDPRKRDALREFMDTVCAKIVCFQETKMSVIDCFTVMQCLGPSFDGFVYLPAIGTRGGVLLLGILLP